MLVADFEIVKESSYIPWNELDNKTILITGANGLIGINLMKYILEYAMCSNLHINIVATVRNKSKLLQKMESFGINNIDVEIVEWELSQQLKVNRHIDYIIHTAAPTSSKFFKDNPVENIEAIVGGTKNVLEFAKAAGIKSMVYLSTMEVFGNPPKGQLVDENYNGSFDTRKPRNSYPFGKLLAENLCCSYSAEYGLDVKILRLTQTFGPGVEYNDGRVFAEFARCAIEKRNIILMTKGETERNYLYTVDAVTAILTVLLKGKSQDIYIGANEDTYCSIYEMAKMVADKHGISVEIQEIDTNAFGYADIIYMKLTSAKLQELGWKPVVGLEEMYEKMIDSFI